MPGTLRLVVIGVSIATGGSRSGAETLAGGNTCRVWFLLRKSGSGAAHRIIHRIASSDFPAIGERYSTASLVDDKETTSRSRQRGRSFAHTCFPRRLESFELSLMAVTGSYIS